jgi:hypothetical protein
MAILAGLMMLFKIQRGSVVSPGELKRVLGRIRLLHYLMVIDGVAIIITTIHTVRGM